MPRTAVQVYEGARFRIVTPTTDFNRNFIVSNVIEGNAHIHYLDAAGRPCEGPYRRTMGAIRRALEAGEIDA